MELTEKQELLFDFVKVKHGTQARKYTGEPYHTHLLSVAEIVSEYEDDCVEIALCHDLFEDTNCVFDDLYKAMIKIGYEVSVAYKVCACVKELTDVFTAKEYPYMNRAKRKECESKRLSMVSYRSQTVKYADILDNASSILEHDESFGKVFSAEVKHKLEIMTAGNDKLLRVCRAEIYPRVPTEPSLIKGIVCKTCGKWKGVGADYKCLDCGGENFVF